MARMHRECSLRPFLRPFLGRSGPFTPFTPFKPFTPVTPDLTNKVRKVRVSRPPRICGNPDLRRPRKGLLRSGVACPALLLAALAIGACAPAARGQCMYEVVSIITGPECSPGDFANFHAHAIDGDGNVVGHKACDIADTAAVWTGGATATVLVAPPGMGETDAFGLFDADHIVGEAVPSGGGLDMPAYWEFGQGMLLELPIDANTGCARGINASGQIVGGVNHTIFGPLQAVLWENGEVQVLNLPLGPQSQAFDINDNGQITGWMGASSSVNSGFIWQNGVTTTLPNISGGQASLCKSINRFGHVAGLGILDGGTSNRAIYWDGSTMADLGLLPGKDRSQAIDINDIDQIVGYSSVGGTSLRAFLWQDGTMYLLQDLVVNAPLGFILIASEGVDNQGQILAFNGGLSYLLRPIGSAPGDVDKNCIVDINDFLHVLTEWGKAGSFADTDDDGEVGILDFLNVLSNWGASA